MSTSDGLYLLVEGELMKVTEAVLASWLAKDPTYPSPKERFEARAIVGVMDQAVQRIRGRQEREAGR